MFSNNRFAGKLNVPDSIQKYKLNPIGVILCVFLNSIEFCCLWKDDGFV